jgi:hypothetical protein
MIEGGSNASQLIEVKKGLSTVARNPCISGRFASICQSVSLKYSIFWLIPGFLSPFAILHLAPTSSRILSTEPACSLAHLLFEPVEALVTSRSAH